MTMHRLLTAIGFILLSTTGRTQKIIDVATADATTGNEYNAAAVVLGQLYTGVKYVRITAGTPFFNEQFMKAQMMDAGGGRYHCNAVRLNLLDNEINFLAPDGKEMIASTPVRRIVLTDSLTGRKYYFVLGEELNPPDRTQEKAWFEVLVNDETSLLRLIKKRLHETPTYGSATTEQDIITIETYYLRTKGTLTPIKNFQDLQTQLSDPQLTQYIHDHHLKGKSPEDYITLITAYNSAKKS